MRLHRLKVAFKRACVVLGVLTWSMIAFSVWRNVTEKRTFSRWYEEIQSNGTVDLVEGAKRYLDLENSKLGRYPCELHGYTHDPRIVYGKLGPNSYYIFTPVDQSGGLIYLEGWGGVWELCLQSDQCPHKYMNLECGGERPQELPSVGQ